MEAKANDPNFVAEWIEAAVDRSKAPGVAGFLMSRELLDRVDGPVKQEIDMQVTLGLAETLSKARQGLRSEVSRLARKRYRSAVKALTMDASR